MQKKIKSVIIYLLGLFITALGVCFSIISSLGVTPSSSTPYVVSIITNIELGTCTTLVLISFVILQIIILGKDFKKKDLLQIIAGSVFGSLITLAEFITSGIQTSDIYFVNLFYCGVGVIFIALGVMLYLSPKILSLPAEGLMQAVAFKFKLPIPTAKIICDCSLVILASILSLIFLGNITGLREGTVISAVFVGLCMKLFNKLFGKQLNDFLNK
ncbi:MAG: DUF6198 family protein [Clostridia bacterium]